MATLKYVRVSQYRSIRDEVVLRMPDSSPLVLVGPNNAGKSNLARAVDLILGERWPGNDEPEDHDFHNRDRSNSPIQVSVDFDGLDYVDWRGDVSPAEGLVWKHTPTDGTTFEVTVPGGRTRRVNNLTREQCVSIYIAADRRLSYQLSYVTRFTLLSKLMKRFHTALIADDSRTERLRAQFDEVQLIFQEVDEFSGFLAKLRQQLESFSEGLEYGLDVDLSAYDPSNYFHALHVQPKQGEEVRSFEELGTGQEQLLAFSIVQAYAEAFHGEAGLLLVVEEPEAHLHPMAQRWLAQKMRGLVEAGVQVIITTHSPAFVNLMGADGLVVVTKSEGSTRIRQLRAEQLADYCKRHGAPAARPDNILPFYAAAATDEILSGLFSRKIVLVEGPTEALALPVYCDRVGLSLARHGISIIPVHGVGNLARWWRFFTAYGIPTYAIFDNDASDDRAGVKRRDLLRTVGVAADRADELLEAHDWLIGARLSVFGQDFETSLRELFGESYEQLEGDAAERGLAGQGSKPLTARYVAERIAMPDESDAHKRFTELTQRIRNLPNPATA
ncbi:MAG: AAA family ATPase [Chloroflexi bacterium]|nr:AAA family ATPase [Chloroflexota bacterium]